LKSRQDIDRAKMFEQLEALGIKNPRKWMVMKVNEMAKKARFVFRTKGMQNLWDEELRGQITDGYWEGGVKLSDLFWSDVPTAAGGRTGVKGTAPHGVRTRFRFRDLVPHLGDRMLRYVQKYEPEATMDDVVAYCDEIQDAVAAVKLEPIRAPEPEGGAGRSDIEKIRHELQWRFEMDDPVQVAETIMVGRGGGRANKYHYFAIWQDRATGEFIGGNAYGSFGKAPKSVIIDRGDDLAKVQRKVQSKINRKERDYEHKDELTPSKYRWRWAEDAAARIAARFLRGG
jgi:hypothetical protein